MAGRPIRGGAAATEDGDHRRPYNPYGDRRIAYESLYNLSTSPEFLFQEESLVHRRSFGDNLTFYTGTAYLAGASGGATAGIYHGFRAAEPGDTLKLRLNRVLNASGQTGRRVGNRIGAIGLLYAGLEGGMSVARDEDDWMNTVVAGLGTGALFKAFSGPRSAAVAGALGGLVAGAAVAGKQVLKRYVPI